MVTMTRLESLLSEVAQKYRVDTVRVMRRAQANNNVGAARMEFCYRALKETAISTVEIAVFFGDSNENTVNKLARRHEEKHMLTNARHHVPQAQEVSLPNRSFDPTSVKIADGHVRGFKITCGLCNFVGDTPCNTSKGHGDDVGYVSALVQKKFEDRGWFVGRNSTKDRCPNCLAEASAAKPSPQPRGPTVPMLRVVASEPESQPVVIPVREITKADIRIINVALEDRYAVDCYKDDWSDEKVAADLGTDVSFVASVREQNFGPARNAKALEEIATAEKVVSDFKERLDGITLLQEQARAKQQEVMDAIEAIHAAQPAVVVAAEFLRTAKA